MSSTPIVAPDWSEHHEEILCPLCEYNLRGLSEPRCPECGFASDWQELTDHSRRRHPYLFEHHPRRNAWSFFETMKQALRPRRFWKTLSPAQPVRTRRLILYWAIAMFLALLPTIPQFMIEGSQVTATMQARRAAFVKKGIQPLTGTTNEFLDRVWPLPPQPRFFYRLLIGSLMVQAMTGTAAAYMAWAWVALATMMIFRISLRRAKIKSAHVLRCTIYSGDCGVVLLAAIAFVGLIVIRQIVVFLPSFPIRQLAWWAALLIIWGGVTYRLIRAYQLYLRFPHAGAVVISVQVIFFLLMAEALTLTLGYHGVQNVLLMR